MGFLQVSKGIKLLLLCIFLNVNSCEGMQGIFQKAGSKKTIRFPVYREVAGFDIYLRFTASKCSGELVEITSRDTNHYIRLTLLSAGPIRLSFTSLLGKGQLDLSMPSTGSFCDGKRHVVMLNMFLGGVTYGVDGSSEVRFFVSRLSVPFSSPAKIIVGRQFNGCVSGSTVVNRFNRSQEYAVGISRGCQLRRTTARPSSASMSSTVSQKNQPSPKSLAELKCQPLTSTTCRLLGYNYTQTPNQLQHRSQLYASTSLSKLLSKLQPKCSSHLIPFLCQLYFPPCLLPQSCIPPCRSLCESVEEDCAPMDRLGFNWPDHLNCKRFPRVNNTVKCFLGSTKVTFKRTALRGLGSKTSVSGEEAIPIPPMKITTAATTQENTHQEVEMWENNTRQKIETEVQVSTSDQREVTTPTTVQEMKGKGNLTIAIDHFGSLSTVRSTTTEPKAVSERESKATKTPGKLASVLKSVTPGQMTSVKTEGRLFGNETTGMIPVTTAENPKSTTASFTAAAAAFRAIPEKERIETRGLSAGMRTTSTTREGSTSQADKPLTRSPPSTITEQERIETTYLLAGKQTTSTTREGSTSQADKPSTRAPPSSQDLWNKEGKCGGLLVTPKGQLTSPGFPRAYPVDSRCKWVIALPPSYHLISFTFQEVNLEDDRNCVYDYVAVFDKLDNQVGGRHCGSSSYPVTKDVKGNIAIVVFRSDSANSKKGFLLSYEAHSCPLLAHSDNMKTALP